MKKIKHLIKVEPQTERSFENIDHNKAYASSNAKCM